MQRTDLETLIAYVDDELTEAERRALEARLEDDVEARGLVQDLRRGDAQLRAALDEPMGAAPPDSLVRTIEAAFGSRRGRGRLSAWAGPVAAAAAALVLGLVVGYQVAQDGVSARLERLELARLQEQRLIEEAVARALEKHVSGQAVDWKNPATGTSGTVTPVLTYRSTGGQWCRKYSLVTQHNGDSETVQAIACREADGHWRDRMRLLDGRSS